MCFCGKKNLPLTLEKEQKPIRFTVVENGIPEQIVTHHGAHPNLMFLLKDELQLDSFGECGGVGRCATCVITAKGITGNSALKDRNEPATLAKLGINDAHIRLSCQIYITQDLNDTTITLMEV